LIDAGVDWTAYEALSATLTEITSTGRSTRETLNPPGLKNRGLVGGRGIGHPRALVRLWPEVCT
jgi:hypothetical protein